MDKFPNVQNPKWTKSRSIGQNPDFDKIPNWTKSRNENNPELDKIQNQTNLKDKESQDE